MTDTARSLSALQTLLADNTSEAISAQDVRDFLVSTLGGHGCLYAASDASAQTGIDTSFAQLTCFDTATTGSQCTMSAAADSGTVSVAGWWIVSANLSFSGSVNTEFTIHIANDGVDTGFGFERLLSATGDVGSGSCMGLLNLSAGTEAVTLIVKADGSSKSITVHAGSSLTMWRVA